MEQPPTRLARGERRAALILEAAVAVFARVGVERATTNAIAAEAGISPGSLYQFFRDKQDIVVALGRRYASELRAAYEEAFEAFDPVTAPIGEVLDRTLDPIVAVKDSNPAFAPMFARPDLPVALTEPVAEVEEGLAGRIALLLSARNPDRETAELRRTADTVMSITRGALGGREVDMAEIKLAISGYLTAKGLR